ncbi:MAG TPA: double-strand break repair helicase AddA [Xanthobacteraceae bacterium]|nr:double-strand break repair helicase AddA [Xanthobacteraceae bacterium]
MIPDSVRSRQAEASDPAAAVFVSANAGSGKTHVLAQRVIRLMLDGGPEGVDPSKILCITFTKAAAANMAGRVYDRLRGWIALDDDALDQAMREIGVTDIDAAKRQRARRLFAAALETPGGLKVQTIHAFCTRVLQQFPFEADVAAHFTVLEERVQSEMLERARMAVLLEAAAAPEKPLGRALKVAVAAVADATLVDALNEATLKREKLIAWIESGFGCAMAQLPAVLGIDVNDDLARVEKDVIDGLYLPLLHWADVVAVFAEGSKNDQDQAKRLSAALAASGDARIDFYISIFLNDDNEPRKKLITRALADRYPELAERLVAEQQRVIGLVERRNGVICRDRTAALVTIAIEVIRRYVDEKQRRGLLDYDDLIDKTHRLLTEIDPNWVHYKLDLGLDHVLIDEAQDTSEKQWDIIKRLVSEFGVGAGARGSFARTVFAVGDEKQSIFSFQGAAPREYDAARRHFEKIFRVSDVGWRFVRFDHSFRSGENVLGAVDEVFRRPDIYRSITSDRDGKLVHLALPDAAPGVVEIWPLIEPDPLPEMEGWDAPFDAISETSPQVKLASKIAATVRGWVDGGAPVGRDGRPMQYGDVLILVRQRSALFGAIIRALKNAGVAVAGADRLVLTEHIAIIDLMALADAVLLTEDDLALAVALKSPLFGFDDDLLFELAWERRGSLRAALAARATDTVEFAAADALLRRCAARARHESPFAFFAWLLGPEQGRRKIFARLGLEAADALDEFLELALEYERHEAPSLQGFVAWLRGATTVVKRDMEITRDEVRVMTVHGAKGLEAPVVILADTTTPPKGSRQPRLLEIEPPPSPPPQAGEGINRIPPPLAGEGREGVSGTPTCIVWAGRRDQDTHAVARAREAVLDENEHEHRRLLYVAMTRAAERLIVCGCHGKIKPKAGCWYDLVRDGLVGRPGFYEVGDGETKRWGYRRAAEPARVVPFPLATQGRGVARGPAGSSPSPAEPRYSEGSATQQSDRSRQQPTSVGGGEQKARTIEVPAWLTMPAPPDIGRPVAMSPSTAYDESAAPRVASPRRPEAAQAQAMARGTLIHRLMQSLPDVEPARREATAQNFLARAGAEFSADDRNRFVSQALAIFADPRFAPLFAPGSRAEVPIVGRLARTGGPEIFVSGQIDRLAITAHAVLIADYKTNRDPPKSVDAAPQAYVQQLALYRAVLGKIYPDRPIRAALVWTEMPDLMEISAAMLDEAAARITSR